MTHLKTITRLPLAASVDATLAKYVDAKVSFVEQKANLLGQ